MTTALLDAPLTTPADSARGSIESLTMPAAASSARSSAHGPLTQDVRRIVLTGFMGAGKTTVGRQLASDLGWTFVDLDALIEQRTSLTVPQIFAEQGEAAFRRLESIALAVALGRKNIVLALGGGTPERLTNRLLLEQTPGTLTVYLHAPLEVLTARCLAQVGGTARPVLAHLDEVALRFSARQPLYQRLAHITVDTVSTNTDETAASLKRIIKTASK
jgi:shikimate kinase